MKRIAMAVLGILFGLGGGTVFGQTLRVPFDFSQSEIGIEATVNGEPLFILLDTGVDPSTIDLQRAEALHLKIDRNAGGQVSGFGNTEQPTAFPTTIQGFAIAGQKFGSFDALASDLSAISAKYGRQVDAFIGYSFLQDKIILIDYPGRTLHLLDRPSAAATSASKSCRTKWSAPMQLLEGENWPLIPQLRLGDAVISATLDTGSSGLITLYHGALDMPGVRSALVQKGEIKSGGFQGEEKLNGYVFNKPIGFGHFELPPGIAVTLRNVKGSSSNLANVGNKLFASMSLKMMLDYRHRTMTFFGDCR
ncbi:MAG TPA: retropepsin-like aspartic protease [Candidatus Sulfotelmatobacter sp.]